MTYLWLRIGISWIHKVLWTIFFPNWLTDKLPEFRLNCFVPFITKKLFLRIVFSIFFIGFGIILRSSVNFKWNTFNQEFLKCQTGVAYFLHPTEKKIKITVRRERVCLIFFFVFFLFVIFRHLKKKSSEIKVLHSLQFQTEIYWNFD